MDQQTRNQLAGREEAGPKETRRSRFQLTGHKVELMLCRAGRGPISGLAAAGRRKNRLHSAADYRLAPGGSVLGRNPTLNQASGFCAADRLRRRLVGIMPFQGTFELRRSYAANSTCGYVKQASPAGQVLTRADLYRRSLRRLRDHRDVSQKQ